MFAAWGLVGKSLAYMHGIFAGWDFYDIMYGSCTASHSSIDDLLIYHDQSDVWKIRCEGAKGRYDNTPLVRERLRETPGVRCRGQTEKESKIKRFKNPQVWGIWNE